MNVLHNEFLGRRFVISTELLQEALATQHAGFSPRLRAMRAKWLRVKARLAVTDNVSAKLPAFLIQD